MEASMSDTLEIVCKVTFKAWTPPKVAHLVGGDKIAIEDLEPHVLDQLAQTWLNHLYAGIGRKPPVIYTEKGNQ